MTWTIGPATDLADFFCLHFKDQDLAFRLARQCVAKTCFPDDETRESSTALHPIARSIAYDMDRALRPYEMLDEPRELRLVLLVMAAENLYRAYVRMEHTYADERKGRSTSIRGKEEPAPKNRECVFRFFKEFCPPYSEDILAPIAKLHGRPSFDSFLKFVWHRRSEAVHSGIDWLPHPGYEGGSGWGSLRKPQLQGVDIDEDFDLDKLRNVIVHGGLNMLMKGMELICRNSADCFGHDYGSLHQLSPLMSTSQDDRKELLTERLTNVSNSFAYWRKVLLATNARLKERTGRSQIDESVLGRVLEQDELHRLRRGIRDMQMRIRRQKMHIRILQFE